MRQRYPVTAAAISMGVAVALAGCSGASEDTSSNSSTSSPSSPSKDVDAAPANPGEPSSESSSPSTDAEAEKAAKEMDPGDVNDAQLKAIKDYLEVRENSESVRYSDVAEWKSALTEVTTDEGLKTAIEQYSPGRMSNARQVGAKNDYTVQVAAGECLENPAWEASKTTLAVQCSLTDLVTDGSGEVVKSGDVDITWPYYGKQQSPMLVLKKQGGTWIVDGDYTGRAS